MKAKIIIAVLICLSIVLTACGGGSGGSESDAQKEIKEKYGISKGFKAKGVENPSWRIASTSESSANDPEEWAEDYYKAYEEPDTVYYVLNFANHTTTLIRNDSKNGMLLYVEQKDGVDEKSLSQGKTYSGTVLKSFYIYYDDNDDRIVEEIE